MGATSPRRALGLQGVKDQGTVLLCLTNALRPGRNSSLMSHLLPFLATPFLKRLSPVRSPNPKLIAFRIGRRWIAPGVILKREGVKRFTGRRRAERQRVEWLPVRVV
jgi:hypothetical protein